MEYYNKWIFATFFCLISSALLFTTTAIATGKNIFILGGEANMAGRGGLVKRGDRYVLDQIVPLECKSNPNILQFNGTNVWRVANDPLHQDINYYNVNGIGPGMPFANRILHKNSSFGVIGLVPCASGGTKLSDWSKGSLLYETLVTRAKASLRDGGVIRALLWYQGESDVGNGASYAANFSKFVVDLRLDLQSPTLPVIQVALDAPVGEHKFDDIITAQLTFNFPVVKTVDAKGQPLQSDNLHLTTEGEIHIGQLLVDAFLQYFAVEPGTSS